MYLLCILLIAALVGQPSDLACAEEEATVPKLPFVAEHPSVEETSVLAAENTSSMQSSGPRDVLCLLVNDAVVTHDSTSSCGDCLMPPSLTSSPCGDIGDSKPVSCDVHLTVNTAVTVSSNQLFDNTAGLSPHSARPVVSPVSTGSDEVFITSCSQNSPLAPSIEPSADCVAAHRLDGQDMQLRSSAFINKTFESSPPQQLHSSLFDDVSRPSSPSESELEPLGGCKDALLNPDHCISDLCLEDNDNSSIFGAAGFQSPAPTDSISNNVSSPTTDAVPFDADHYHALSVVNSRIEHDCSSLLDVSNLDVSSFSNSYNVTPLVQVAHSTLVCDEAPINSCTVSDTTISPFRSPPKFSACDETSLYNCITPVNSSSSFRSPPRSSASMLDGKRMWNRTALVEDVPTSKVMLPSNVTFSDVLDSTANIAIRTACDEDSPDVFTVKDGAVFVGSDAHISNISECRSSQLTSPCDQCTLDWTSESSVAAALGTSVETPVNEVTLDSSGNNVHYEIRCQNGSPPWYDMYCADRASRQASVKQLKCRFESQQDLGSQVGAKSSPNFDFIPGFAESNFSFTSHPASAVTTDGDCAEFPDSNAVQYSYNDHNSEHVSPSSIHEATEAAARDRRQSSISARISCFEPVMSGCRKENKRARLSSSGSAVLDPSEKQLTSSSHSVNEPFAGNHRRDADGWFVESPQRGLAKRYQRCSSAGHEDLLALLNIPATSAKNIPRVSERKRMFEVEPAVDKAESSSVVACNPPVSECVQYSCGSQRLSGVDKENSLHMYEGNCQGRVNSRRSLFEGTSVCHVRNDSVDSDSSVELDCRPFRYSVNRIKTKSRCLQTAVPVETSANSFERFKLT